jgi:hypothetical protein
MRGRSIRLCLLVGCGVLGGCEEPDLTLPSAEQVESYYQYEGELSVEMSGNVAEITIRQSGTQLRRGGRLWAMVGPYVLLFSEPTRQLITDFGGLGGVRVITTAPGGHEVARALLPRDALNELTWRRALNIAGIARRDGTEQPSRLEALVQWGQDHTEFEYNPRYVGGR